MACAYNNSNSKMFYPLILTLFIISSTTAFQLDLGAVQETTSTTHKKSKKKWTVIVYMAADNDLRGFAARNIKQMATEGSNEHINIIAELHIRLSGNKKITRRYFIEQGRIIHVNANDPSTQKMDSGDHQTLISCCSWAIANYPAENYALMLWNHGTGIIDPSNGRLVHATELFSFNPALNKLELDRNIGFLDFINRCDQDQQDQRGICWDDSSGNYLTNQKLAGALQHICKEFLDDKKLAILGFDACLMSMTEVADLVKDYAEYMVGSQEVELGTGWNYQLALSQFKDHAPTPHSFAQYIVAMYEQTYNKVTTDYTLSAIDLSKIDLLTANVNNVSNLLLYGLAHQEYGSVKNVIKLSRERTRCTHFDEPSYIDLHHFYTNLQTNLEKIQLTKQSQNDFSQQLSTTLKEGCSLIENIVIANTTSKNLARARGLSIYFPERRLHFSYEKTPFAKNNEWLTLVHRYLPS